MDNYVYVNGEIWHQDAVGNRLVFVVCDDQKTAQRGKLWQVATYRDPDRAYEHVDRETNRALSVHVERLTTANRTLVKDACLPR